MTATLANVQVAIKNSWPDGSAKFAIVSGKAQLAAGAPLNVALSSTSTPNWKQLKKANSHTPILTERNCRRLQSLRS